MILKNQIRFFLLVSLFFFVNLSTNGFAATVKTITDHNVDEYGGNDIVEVYTYGSNSFGVRIDSNKYGRSDYTYMRDGAITAANIQVVNLDKINGDEIIIFYTDYYGKGKLLIINYSAKFTTNEGLPDAWTSSIDNIISANLNISYDPNFPATVQDLVLVQIDSTPPKELVGVGKSSSGNQFLFIIHYRDYSTSGITVHTYTPGGILADEFIVNNLDYRNGSEIIGFYNENSIRKLFIVNNTLENSGYSEKYSKFEKFSFGQGILSPHIRYQSNFTSTSDLTITNLDSSNGRELIGLYLKSATQVGLFRISYRDSNFDVSQGSYIPPAGGIYLGYDNRLSNAEYTIGNIDGDSLHDIYGYYGNPELQGGFVYYDNFSSLQTYASLASNSPFHSLTDSGIPLADIIYDAIDADGDGHHDGEDGCPLDSTSYLDNDDDGICQPADQCDNNPVLSEPGVCGCSTADDDGDNWLNCEDECPSDPSKHEVGICGCGLPDIDSDNDGSYDCNDQCPADPQKTEPLICGCGNEEVSSDNNGDGVIDAADCVPDECPADPNKYEAGICGCGIPDMDSDGDGSYNCNDQCPFDPNKTSRGTCGCFKVDTDSNGNGTIDCLEQSGEETVYYYHNDPTGTPLTITDNMANIVWEGDYLPFGEEYAFLGGLENNRQFIGKEKDIETGLSYFGARYMDVGIGRFMAADPVRAVDIGSGEVNPVILADSQRLNLYGYGLNNPYRYVDSDGEFAMAAYQIWINSVHSAGLTQQSKQNSHYFSSSDMRTIILSGVAVSTGRYDIVLNESEKESNSPDTSKEVDEPTVKDQLKNKKGSIRNAPLPPGSPSWDDIEDTPMSEIEKSAKANRPGYKTIKKLLKDKRFDK